MSQLFQMGFQRQISADLLHREILNPAEKLLGPGTVDRFIWQIDPIEEQEGLNLILTPGLFSNHALTGSNQAAIFQFRTGRDVNPFQIPAPQAAGQFAAVGPIPLVVFLRFLLVVGTSAGLTTMIHFTSFSRS
jgi:hypothetical protein